MNRIILIFFLFPFFLYSQEQHIQTTLVNVDASSLDVWTTYYLNSDIRIEYKYTNCDPERGFDYEGVIFRITNLSNSKITLSWDKLLYYAGTCRTCDFLDEYHYQMSIGGNQVVEGDCSPDSGYDLKFFSKFIDQSYSQGDQLTAFQFGNLIIVKY